MDTVYNFHEMIDIIDVICTLRTELHPMTSGGGGDLNGIDCDDDDEDAIDNRNGRRRGQAAPPKLVECKVDRLIPTLPHQLSLVYRLERTHFCLNTKISPALIFAFSFSSGTHADR